MVILKYIAITLLILVVFAYGFWLKLKRGKPGRIHGSEVEKKTYEEAIVIDTRWRKQYATEHAVNAICVPIKVLRDGSKLLDNYKDKDIILYCVVDVTSRNTEKILRERGFTKLYIGDGVKQYSYGKAMFKNVLMAEMKYLSTVTEHVLVNVGTEEFEESELKANLKNVLELTKEVTKTIFIYGNDEKNSIEAAKLLANNGKTVVNLIEPMDKKKYILTTYNKKDFEDNPAEENSSDCG